MNTLDATAAAAPTAAPAAARAVLRLLQRLEAGRLELRLPDGTQASFGAAAGDGLRAAIHVHDWQVFGAVLRRGDLGFAESYIDGHWSTPDLPVLLQLLVAQRESLERMVYGSWWGSLLDRVRHLLNRNSRRGSRRNIHAHYDLGNEFYALWLDGSMNYSGAWFEGDPGAELTRAQQAKVRRAIEQSGIAPGQRLLELGCGWGALAELAAAGGARVTGITLSNEQLSYARRRLQQRGLAERTELRPQDYRDLDDPPFDAVVSIEMFEAVGREYWPQFFATVARCLKPGAKACIQTITIRDDLFERYVRGTDFIQQYVFPGGLLPSAGAFRAGALRAGLAVREELAFGADYAETLRRWRLKFLSQEAQVRRLGFDTRFVRIWDFYLAYCQAAFTTGNTDVVQFTLQRP